MAVRDNKEYIRVLVYSYYTTITGWGFLLRYNSHEVLVLEDGKNPNPVWGLGFWVLGFGFRVLGLGFWV